MKTRLHVDVRSAAVADRFYPSDPAALREMVFGFLAEGHRSNLVPKAIIAPHAGFIYSGPIAGSAYTHLARISDQIKRVILFGPSHYYPFSGLAVSGASAFRTPLGDVPVDLELRDAILDLPHVQVSNEIHTPEHSLETHLPFLQIALKKFSILPIVTGQARPEQVSELLEKVWGGPETLIDVSSDLSHYLDEPSARRLDEATSRAIEQLDPDAIAYEQACGRVAIQGLLMSARKHGLKCITADLRTSGDTAGPKDQVVGYGAYVLG